MQGNLLPLEYDLSLSKLLRRMAQILFILSLCLPAVNGDMGLQIWSAGLFFVVWVMSGMLLCADWLCSLMPYKQHLIVRLAIMICLIWAVGLIGLGQYQQNSNDKGAFGDHFSVFYNPLGHL